MGKFFEKNWPLMVGAFIGSVISYFMIYSGPKPSPETAGSNLVTFLVILVALWGLLAFVLRMINVRWSDILIGTAWVVLGSVVVALGTKALGSSGIVIFLRLFLNYLLIVFVCAKYFIPR